MKMNRRALLIGLLVPLAAIAMSACDDMPKVDTIGGGGAGGSGVIGSTDPVFSNSTTAAAAWGGKGTEEKPWLINGAQALKRLIEQVNDEKTSFTDNYFMLMTDIEVTADEWNPIGIADTCYFAGYFDGNGKTISGKLQSENHNRFGFFGYVYSAKYIKNLRVSADVINNYEGTGAVYTGAIVGFARNLGNMKNCHATGTVMGGRSTNNASHTGGLTGLSSQGRIEDCTVAEMTITGGETSGTLVRSSTGGLTGYLSQSDVRNCQFTDVIVAGAPSINSYAGGVSGFTVNSRILTSELSGVQVTGTTGPSETCLTGGITGGVTGVSDFMIKSCTISGGSVTGGTASEISYTGGLVGQNTGPVHLCSTSATVTGGTAAEETTPLIATGGLVGENSGTDLYGCNTNTGTVNSDPASSTDPDDNRVGNGEPVNEEAHSESGI